MALIFNDYMKRVLYLIKLYLCLVIIFIVIKPFFMFYNHSGHDFSAGDVLSVMGHGLTLDLSTSLYFIILPFLAVVVTLWCNRWREIRYVLKSYYGIIAAAFALIFTVDMSLYEFWGFKLDSSVFQYIDTTGDAFASVSIWFILVRILVISVVGYLYYKALVRLTPKSLNQVDRKVSVYGSIIALLMVVPIIIGIRGGTSESTTNIGQVYYSSNQFLNHSAVNPVFGFMSSFERTADDNCDYNLLDDKVCASIMKGLYNTESTDVDTLLNTRRPNVLIVIMEGCGGEFTELGNHPEAMPNLNRIANEGVYFTNCYGNSYRTDRGTVCALSGYLSFPTTSVMKIPSKSRTLPSIAHSLVKDGYSTDFLYGGDIDFTNMRSYLLSTGYQHIFSKENYTTAEQNTSKWGVRDEITFETLYNNITHRKNTPWFTTFLTLSSHEPWVVPIHRFSDERLNAFAYLDDCIGHFMNRMEKSPQWKNMLVIFLPDHGIKFGNIEETDQLRNHIPMIWAGGAIKKARRVSLICNQSDLPATLLGQLGMKHHEFTFSRDVMSRNYVYPFAVHTYSDGLSTVDSTGFTVYDLNSKKAIVDIPSHNQHREDLGKAVLQTAAKDLKNRK